MAIRDVRTEPLQLSFNCINVFFLLTDEQKNQLINSDAGWFRTHFLPLIPKDIIAKLYSEKESVRPAKFAISHVAALFYVRLTGLTEEEFLVQLPWNLQYQFALGIDCWDQSVNFGRDSFRLLRERFRKYDATHPGEHIWDSITHTIDMQMAEKMGLLSIPYNERYKHAFRMDTLMVGMQATQRPRLDVVYSTISICIKLLLRKKLEIPDELKHFLEKGDRRSIVYYHGTLKEYIDEGLPVNKEKPDELTQNQRKEAITKHRLEALLPKAIILKEHMIQLKKDNTDEFRLLSRMIDDQTCLNENGELVVKNKKDILASSLQTPYEPDATYRFKAGKGYYGYVGYIVDLFNSEGEGIIVFRDLKNNLYSDQKFMSDFLTNHDSKLRTGENERSFISTDAGFVSVALNKRSDSLGFDIYCAGVHGKAPDIIFADFVLSDDCTEILRCPKGYKPDRSLLVNKNTNSFRIRFMDKKCASCENMSRCNAQITGTTDKRGSSFVDISESKITAAICIKMRNGQDTQEAQEAQEYINKRNAIEGINGVMRTRYDVDNRAVSGITFALFNFFTACTCYSWKKYLQYCRKNTNRYCKTL